MWSTEYITLVAYGGRNNLMSEIEKTSFLPVFRKKGIKKLECGPMPNVMAALPNIGGALCSTPQSLADAHCSSAVQ